MSTPASSRSDQNHTPSQPDDLAGFESGFDSEVEEELAGLEPSEEELKEWLDAIEAHEAQEAHEGHEGQGAQGMGFLEIPSNQKSDLLGVPRTMSANSVNSEASANIEITIQVQLETSGILAEKLKEPEEAIPADLKLRLQREATLKRLLYRITLEREGAIYEKDPAMVQRKGTLLNQCYTFTMGCPLLMKRGNTAARKMKELLLLLPTLNKHVKAGTKREILTSLSDFLVGIFITQKRTTQEHIYADQLFMLLWDTAPEDSTSQQTSKSEEDDARAARRRRIGRMRKVLALIVKDIETNGGPGRLVQVLREAKTIKELPPPYREFFDTLKRLSAPGLPDIIEDPTKVEKLKALQARLPESVIVNIFRYTNPLKLVTALSHLLLMNILGGKPLLQRIILVLSDTHRTEKELNEVGAQIPAELKTNILNFIQANYPFDSEADYGVINQNLALAALGSKHGEISQDLLHQCVRFFSLEIRRRQKSDFIEIMESPQIMSILRHLFPVLQEPLMDMYRAGDIPKILTRAFAALRKVIKIGEATMVATEERIRQYQEIVDELQEMGYTFLHGMAKKDKGTLHLLADWLIGSWMKADHLFELEAILFELTKEEHAELWKACDAITQHGLQGGSRLNTPTFPIIDKVVSIFQQLCVGGPYQLASSDSLVSASSSSD